MFKLCVLTRWDFNFCVGSSPLQGHANVIQRSVHMILKKSEQTCQVWALSGKNLLGNSTYFFFFLLLIPCDLEIKSRSRGGEVAQLVEQWTGTQLTQVQFPSGTRDFSLRVSFQCRLSYGVCTLPCAIGCIYICVHIKDPIIYVTVWWIMETLKHPACTVDLIARLSQLVFPREGNPNFL